MVKMVAILEQGVYCRTLFAFSVLRAVLESLSNKTGYTNWS